MKKHLLGLFVLCFFPLIFVLPQERKFELNHGYCSFSREFTEVKFLICKKNTDIDVDIYLEDLIGVAQRIGFYEVIHVELLENKDLAPAYSFNHTEGGSTDISRYIAYSKEFYESITDDIVIHYLVLAHELGHHIDDHSDRTSDDSRQTNHKYELKADWIAGFLLGKFSIQTGIEFSIKRIRSAMRTTVFGEISDSTFLEVKYTDQKKYPSYEERVNHIVAGYFEAVAEDWVTSNYGGGDGNYYLGSIAGIPTAKIEYPDNHIYIGGWKEVGSGIKNRPTKVIKQGFGVEIFRNDTRINNSLDWNANASARYIGRYNNGLEDGYGTRYFGSWELNKQDIQRYFGGWNKGKMESSNGLIFWNDPSRYYCGEIMGGVPHGYGEKIERNERVYQKGQFENGKFIK